MLTTTLPRLLPALVALAFASATLPALAAPAAAKGAAASQLKAHAAFDKWADNFAADWVRLSPQGATSSQYFSGAEQAALDRELTPITEAQRARYVALARAGVARLDRFLAGKLSPMQRDSANTMRWSLVNAIAREPYQDHNFIFSQMNGTHTGLVNFLTQTHPLRNAADVDSYLARLEQVSMRMDEATALGRKAAAKSLIPPRFILERAQGQVDAFLAPAADKNVFVTSLAQRAAEITDLSAEARTAAVARATRSRFLPEVPTFVELGYRDVLFQDWLGVFAPADTPAARVRQLNQALNDVARSPRGAEGLETIGIEAEIASVEAFAEMVKTDHARYQSFIQKTNFREIYEKAGGGR